MMGTSTAPCVICHEPFWPKSGFVIVHEPLVYPSHRTDQICWECWLDVCGTAVLTIVSVAAADDESGRGTPEST